MSEQRRTTRRVQRQRRIQRGRRRREGRGGDGRRDARTRSRELRKRVCAALLACVLALSQVLALAQPQVASAAPTTFTMSGFTGDGNVGYYVFEGNGGFAICANIRVQDPKEGDTFIDPTPITQVSSSLLSGVDPYSYAYACAFMPLGGSFNDYGFTGSEAEKGAATFVLNVLLQGGYVDGNDRLHWDDGELISTNTIYESQYANKVRPGELEKIERLVADAKAHAGQSGWYDGSATYWTNSSSNARQNLITFNPVERSGGLELHKSSQKPDITSGNTMYSLEGAVYGVYRDQACTDEAGRMTTDQNGDASIDGLAVGTYYVKEIYAPQGFAKDENTYTVQINSGVDATLRVSDAPQHAPLAIEIHKVDAASGQAVPQGDASFAGAEFTVSYYAGDYASVGELPASPTRQWVLKTDADGFTSLAGAAEDPSTYYVSGDQFYYTPDGEVTLPLGTITVQETKSPEGYKLPDSTVHLQRITSSGSTETVSAPAIPNMPEPVVTGGVKVPKIDHELQEGVAQGDATLAGAKIGIFNESEGPVWFDGNKANPGELVTTIETDASGVAQTGPNDLPYGTYSLKELTPPPGYLPNETWNPTISIQQDGVVILADTLEDTVMRGGGEVTKVDGEWLVASPQGDAELNDAEIRIWNRSEQAVLVDGVLYQPNDIVATIYTNGSGAASVAELPYGTYEARETGASEGYLVAEDWSVTFQIREDGQVVRLDDLPEPIVRGGVHVRKTDLDWGTSDPQGDATLEGAEFTIWNRSKHAVRVDGTDYEPGEAVKVITTNAAGEALTSQDALPYGTYEVRETKPPVGYNLNEEWARTFQVRAHGQIIDLTAEADVCPDDVIRGGVMIRKTDRELMADKYGIDLDGTQDNKLGEIGEADPETDVTDASLALGGATLAGARFEITNNSLHAVRVDGADYDPGEVCLVIETGEDGIAKADADALPYGTYHMEEVAPPEGYFINDDWSLDFQIREEGRVYDYTADDLTVDEQVYRGDFRMSKALEGTQERLAMIPFKLTDTTTGEWHILVTDENGMIDTSEGWNSHFDNTNASDAALREDGTVDESKLEAYAGIWFTGRSEVVTDPIAAKGALPYGTYELEELPCSANEGLQLVRSQIVITRDSTQLDLGTFDNDGTRTETSQDIATTLVYGDGTSKSVPAGSAVDLVDQVSYSGLEAGAEYRLDGELHAIGSDGSDLGVVASGSTTFTPEATSGTAEVPISVDTSELQGATLVAYERLYDAEGTLVAEHADPSDAKQTVYVPAISTALLSDNTADHDAPSWADSAVTDTVTLQNLVVGEQYCVTGSLHVRDDEGADAGVLTSSDGTEASATTTFEATDRTMTVQLPYEIESSKLAGVTLVAFATLSNGSGELASHADVADEGQTVHVPALATTATSAATGDQCVPAYESQVVVDVVHATNLVVGKTYDVTGELHVKTVAEDGTAADGGVLTDAEGNPVTASTSFTAEATEQDVTLEFPVDGSLLAGQSVVAFETLSADDVTLAIHAEINDENQTVLIPAVSTSLTEGGAGSREIQLVDDVETVTLTDVVTYENLIPGEEYTVVGTLRYRGEDADGNAVDDGPLTAADGSAIASTVTFTPETPDGQVEVSFEVPVEGLSGRALVAFEQLWHNDVLVASHEDPSDEDQTVRFVPPTDEELPEPEEDYPEPEEDFPEPGEDFPNTSQGPAALMAIGAGGVTCLATLVYIAYRIRKTYTRE